ncbi:MAG: hypothetical protein QW231_05550, partial [Candidatus Bathyarchaeia archaeon]
PGDVSELAGRLGTSEITIKRRAGELKGLGLIRRGRRGYEATKKGVALFRMIQLIPMIPIPGFQRNDFYQKGTGEKTSIKSINCITTIPPDSDNKKDEPGLLPHTQKACEVCGSHGSFSIVREGGVHYLCGKCLGEWKGPL